MLTTLEVSEFCITINNYFKKNNIPPQTMSGKVIDVAYTQAKINEALSKHIFIVDTSKKISDVEMLKLKYFKSSFDDFKNNIYKESINKKKETNRTAYNTSVQFGPYLFFQLARDFTNKFDEVIDNWNTTYTPIIEKKLLTDLIEPVVANEKEKTQNKI